MKYKGWKKYKLSELVNVIGGGTPKRNVKEYWNGDIPWISIKDINNDYRLVYNTEEYITEKGLSNSSAKLLDKGDIVISARGTVGKVAQLARPMAFNQSCYGLKVNKEMALNEFIYYWLKYNVDYIQANTHGSVFDTITRNTFDNLEILLPSKKEQEFIVQVLVKLDDKIELNNQIISNLEQLSQTLFKRWFIDFEFPNEHGEPYRSSGGEMKSSKLGEIPIHFDIKKADELGSFKNGINYNRNTLGDSLFKIINVRNLVGNQFFVKDELETISIDHDKAKDYIVQQGDILIARSANPGETVYINSHDDSTIFSGFIIRFRVKNPLLRQYLFQYVLRLKNNLNAYSSGTTLQNINQQILKNLEIVIPTDDVLVKFNKITVTLFNAIEEKKKENNKLALLRDTLLPKLLSGEIELPDEDEVTEDVMVQ